jgi:hypothetical protein
MFEALPERDGEAPQAEEVDVRVILRDALRRRLELVLAPEHVLDLARGRGRLRGPEQALELGRADDPPESRGIACEVRAGSGGSASPREIEHSLKGSARPLLHGRAKAETEKKGKRERSRKEKAPQGLGAEMIRQWKEQVVIQERD